MRRLVVLIVMLSLLAACGAPGATGTGDTTAGTGAASAAGSGAAGATAGSRTYRVGIIQQISHPALDAARKGIEDALKESGLAIEIDAKNPQGDVATLATMTDAFRDQKVDLVFAIGTQPAQAALKSLQGSNIPIVFNALTDPYKAGVAKSETEHPGITGIQALPPVSDAFDLMLKIDPAIKKVGNIWTSNEKNSEVATGIAREYAKSKGIEFVERQVTKADEVLAAAESLAGDKVDAIFISTDSTVVSALEAVVKVANENAIGLFCNDPASAERGCATGLGLDYYDNGYNSAKELGLPILNGTSVDTLPIKKQEKKLIALNTAAAQQQGVQFPTDVTQSASKTYDAITPKQ